MWARLYAFAAGSCLFGAVCFLLAHNYLFMLMAIINGLAMASLSLQERGR